MIILNIILGCITILSAGAYFITRPMVEEYAENTDKRSQGIYR